MKKLNSFLRTTFFGGFLVVLPIILLILVLNWFYEFLLENIRPIINLLIQTARMSELIAAAVAVVIMLLLFFLVGLLVQTRLGKFFFEIFEERVLKKSRSTE